MTFLFNMIISMNLFSTETGFDTLKKAYSHQNRGELNEAHKSFEQAP